MKNTDHLDNGLDRAMDLLRQANQGASASSSVETQLRAAFRRRHSTRRRMLFAWTGAAAAGLLIGAAVWRAAVPVSVEAPEAIADLRPAAPAVQPRPEQKPAVVAAVRPKPARKRTAPPPAVSAAARTETQEFLAIPYAPPFAAEDRGEVIRVQVPRQSIRSLGIPVNAERLFEQVPADVLIGQDGIARGIRLIRTNEPN